jgi:hypothetical protein
MCQAVGELDSGSGLVPLAERWGAGSGRSRRPPSFFPGAPTVTSQVCPVRPRGLVRPLGPTACGRSSGMAPPGRSSQRPTRTPTTFSSTVVRHGKGDICCFRHMSPYVALGTMLRWIANGGLLVGIGLVGATYFGWAEAFEGREQPGLAAGGNGLGVRRSGVVKRESLDTTLARRYLLVRSSDSWRGLTETQASTRAAEICCARVRRPMGAA